MKTRLLSAADPETPKLAAEIIDGYDEVRVSASHEDPTVCLVEFGFAVAHGLNQVHLTVHIEI